MTEDLKRKILAIALKAVIPMTLMGIFGLVAGSSGFMQVWAQFRWDQALPTFFGVLGFISLCAGLFWFMEGKPGRDRLRAWISLSVFLLCVTAFSGLIGD